MGGGSSNYSAPDPGVTNVNVSQSAAREAAKAATQYLGDEFMQNMTGGSASGAMSDSYAQALDEDKSRNNWEKMIAGIGSKNASTEPAPVGGNTRGW